jgi:drug/metabolite transporter (DMT)-like permease
VTVLLAALAALCYGTSDFLGGLAARRRDAVTVLLYSYPVGAVLMALLLPAFPGHVTGRTVLFGVGGGVAGMVGVVLLYRLLAIGPMNVVSPISAVLSAAVPVAFGVATGERPRAAAWAGIVLAGIAVVLVSRTSADSPNGPLRASVVALACVAGVGFGSYFILLARAGSGTGLWPLLVSRVTSAALIPALALRRGRPAPIGGRLLALVLVSGALDALANLWFLLASRHGLLSLASVITSLYPAMTVVLAVGVLRERTGRLQLGGLALAAVSIALLTG